MMTDPATRLSKRLTAPSMFQALAMVVAIAMGILTAGAAQAAGARVADFVGKWQGVADTEGADSSTITPGRVLYLTVTTDGNAFTVEWAAFLGETTSEGAAAIKTQSLRFVPSEIPGIWRAEGRQDLLAGNFAYARLSDRTLSVYSITAVPKGILETHIYDRTLGKSGNGIAFTYRRLVEGKLKRTVKGTLARN